MRLGFFNVGSINVYTDIIWNKDFLNKVWSGIKRKDMSRTENMWPRTNTASDTMTLWVKAVMSSAALKAKKKHTMETSTVG